MADKKIAILGTRGIPASYGGFETFAEELSKRLIEKEYKVTVYNRRYFFKENKNLGEYNGAKIVTIPTFPHKYLDTVIHSLLSFIHTLFKKYDIILLCNAANAPFSWITKFRKQKLLINVDGIERKRGKWNLFGRLWYFLGEHCSVLFADRIIADAKIIDKYYKESYLITPTIIAYGANSVFSESKEALEEYKIKPNKYFLYLSRLEPENNALGVIEAYVSLDEKIKKEYPLVIVGDAPYAKEYINRLKETADKNVIFTGYLFGTKCYQIRQNCYLYIQATEVGGTHPALVEALGYGNAIIANSVPEHLEVLEDTALYYEYNNFKQLKDNILKLINNLPLKEELSKKSITRAKNIYNWDKVSEQYINLFKEIGKNE